MDRLFPAEQVYGAAVAWASKFSSAAPYALRAIKECVDRGIETDLESRVLAPGGEPVAGLYAAGEASGFGGGGVHGYRALEGTFAGGCLFSGRIAGRAAAAAV